MVDEIYYEVKHLEPWTPGKLKFLLVPARVVSDFVLVLYIYVLVSHHLSNLVSAPLYNLPMWQVREHEHHTDVLLAADAMVAAPTDSDASTWRACKERNLMRWKGRFFSSERIFCLAYALNNSFNASIVLSPLLQVRPRRQVRHSVCSFGCSPSAAPRSRCSSCSITSTVPLFVVLASFTFAMPSTRPSSFRTWNPICTTTNRCRYPPSRLGQRAPSENSSGSCFRAWTTTARFSPVCRCRSSGKSRPSSWRPKKSRDGRKRICLIGRRWNIFVGWAP